MIIRNRIPNNNNNNQTNIGPTLLQIAFIVLKLCHVIDWSWWWVLAPTWITLIIVIIIALIITWPELKSIWRKK